MHNPSQRGPVPIPERERFARLCALPDADGHVLWLATPNNDGYGWFRREVHTGRRPADENHVHHKCEVALCMAGDHLEEVTPAQHVLLRSNSITAANFVKTHCYRGHPLSGENLRIDYRGHRVCRECVRINERARGPRHRIRS